MTTLLAAAKRLALLTGTWPEYGPYPAPPDPVSMPLPLLYLALTGDLGGETPGGAVTASTDGVFVVAGLPPSYGVENTIAALGDSITANGLNNAAAGPRNWLMHGVIASGGILQWIDNCGTGGATVANILASDLPTLLTLDPLPGFVPIIAGTNDAGTTALASYQASYTAILDALDTAGIVGVPCAVPPSSSTSKHADIAAYNAWLPTEAASRGLPFIDWTGDLDDGTGNWKVTLPTITNDGTHPEAATARVMGEALWREFAAQVSVSDPWTARLATSNSDPQNLLPNALNTTDTNADGLADGWSLFSAGGSAPTALTYGTPSLVTPTDGVTLGKWQRLTRAAASPSGYVRLTTGWLSAVPSPGDVIEVVFRFQCSLTSASSADSGGQVGLYQYNSTTVPGGNVDGAAGSRNRFWINAWEHAGGPVTVRQRLTVRSAATNNLVFIFNLGDPPDGDWMQVAQLTVRNLTTLGEA